jgi:peroxiredoxin
MSSVDTGGVKRSGLAVGDLAPDFELPALIAGVKKRFRLSEECGKNHVVLAFYPFNWEQLSSEQFCSYQVERDSFLKLNAETVGICVESIMNTTVWEREIGPFDFPLCSDFWPHGAVASQYGVLQAEGNAAGASERAIFVVEKTGKIAWRKVYRACERPDVAEILGRLGAI